MKNFKMVLLLFSYHLFLIHIHAQTIKDKAVVVAFYNCENLYDTINDQDVQDEEFLPEGPRHYNTSIYREKTAHLAQVISSIGLQSNKDGVALLGVAEVENKNVLTDILQQPALQQRGLNIIHYNSKDARGVDVALLYHPGYFVPDSSRSLYVNLPADAATPAQARHHTRDILWVRGKLCGQTVHVYVNHWPSRLGGRRFSFPARAAAAQTCRRHIDSVLTAEPGSRIIVMGDFNDDPTDISICRVLKAIADTSAAKRDCLYNPWIPVFKKGRGSLAFGDAWSLFDQIFVSHAFLPGITQHLYFQQAAVFHQPYMTEQEGRYKGYPRRTWNGLNYNGGYSDHFPVYLLLANHTLPD